MAELILFGIVDNLLGKLGSLAVQEIGLASGVTSELNKLKETLETIKAVRLDAEKQYDPSSEVSVYLERLKDACYAADDVLDEFEIVALRKQVLAQQGSIKKKVGHFFSSSNPIAFRFKMGHKIKKIRERLDAVAADKNKFHLNQNIVDNRIIPVWRETHSFINPSDVIGRDDDQEKIVDVLMQLDQNRHLSVIPIVGIGGLGKTTLAKSVYNDNRVIRHFDLRKWVCVSDVFDKKKMIEEIVERKDLSMQQLLEPLQQTLGEKRYLLIMDDVWNEDINKWREVKDLLMCGAYGSKIVVTTRNTSVTSIMDPIYTHNLKGLSPKVSLSLLMKLALGEGPIEEYQNLVEIGKVIVSKCKGVPLAIKTLGNLLYMKIEERDWHLVRDNEIWQLEQKESDILPALKLSYDQLPSSLKQCFAVCSIFSKDFDFSSIYLIYFWMALGLLKSSDQKEWEEIGQRYFTQLWSRSFFQDVEDRFLSYTFKIHDLLHDLSLSVTPYEHATLSKDSPIVLDQKVRHISFCDDDLLRNELPSSILQLKNLRTIIRHEYKDPHCGYSFVETCISRFKCMRVLDLRNSSFETLPSSISGLKHLRFLDLSGNKNIKSLPNSICKLQSLQSLRILSCTELQKLPKDIGNLISLRYLLLTTQERCLLRKGFGSLTSLRSLILAECHNLEYMFANDGGIKIQSSFANLRTLVFTRCESLVYLPHDLRYLTTLQTLWIFDCKNLELDLTDEGEEEDTIHGGDSLTSLGILRVSGLPKLVALPLWILQHSATTLTRIVIDDCCNFNTFPKDLKYLQVIWIINCPKLKSLPEGTSCFSKLKEIRIKDCDELVRRCLRQTGEDWHKISHVHDIYLNSIKI